MTVQEVGLSTYLFFIPILNSFIRDHVNEKKNDIPGLIGLTFLRGV